MELKTSELEEVAKWEGVEFKQGDILIVRTGFTEELGAMNAEESSDVKRGRRDPLSFSPPCFLNRAEV